MTTEIAVNGAGGRMGRTVIDAAADRDDVDVVLGIAPEGKAVPSGETPPGTGSGTDVETVGGVPTVDPADLDNALDTHDPAVVVDFSVPAATARLAEACADRGVALVVGTTGLDDAQCDAVDAAAATVPVCRSTNFARGIQALLGAVEVAVDALDGYDLELVETHHSGKVDAPSGTARTIVETIRRHRDVEPVFERSGHAPRRDDEIGVFARRAGDVRGEHDLVLAGDDELVSLTHRAQDRSVFAAGALDAAVFLDSRDSGRYEFRSIVEEEQP